MKNLITIFCIVIALGSCKKKSDVTEMGKNETSQYPPHCFNKIKDSDETDIDCGGKCEACANGTPVAPICTVSVNTITINNATYTISLGAIDTGAYYTVSGVFNTSSNYRLILKSAPDQTKVYSIDGNVPDQDNEVALQVDYNFSTLNLTSGKVYFKNNGSSYTAVVCSGVGAMSNISIPVKANFNFQ
jgi:hypothetical protein